MLSHNIFFSDNSWRETEDWKTGWVVLSLLEKLRSTDHLQQFGCSREAEKNHKMAWTVSTRISLWKKFTNCFELKHFKKCCYKVNLILRNFDTWIARLRDLISGWEMINIVPAVHGWDQLSNFRQNYLGFQPMGRLNMKLQLKRSRRHDRISPPPQLFRKQHSISFSFW